MTQKPDEATQIELSRLADLLAQNPELLGALAERLARRPAFRKQLSDLMQEERILAPPQQPQQVLDRSIVSSALRAWLAEHRSAPAVAEQPFQIIIELNLKRVGQSSAEALTELIGKRLKGAVIDQKKSKLLPQYLFVTLNKSQLGELVTADAQDPDDDLLSPKPTGLRTIHRIWPDFDLTAALHRTTSTIKAQAARASFAAGGQGIVWAVLDSGIDGTHPHFKLYENLEVTPLEHQSFTAQGDALTDEFGHGTHVAGIIAGSLIQDKTKGADKLLHAVVAHRDGEDVAYQDLPLSQISGVAPECKLVSYKVLDQNGKGQVSNLLAAIAHIQQVNGNGKLLQIHGVNISIGYGFDPEWFACGQSPLCVEVDRLVRSGVVVVVAAGNTGYGTVISKLLGAVPTTLALTINDPGNAELAITVGAAHRESPHQYGVSYFSSKGPTGDGRLKPDLVAPGERILSCAAGQKRSQIQAKGVEDVTYVEDSGTSMAAPHVSGAAAVFLSAQREFVGRPEEVKRILMATATDLGRHRDFQGAGMVDVMRAIQSV